MNKFQRLVEERGVNLTRLSKETGVNRGTLSRLYSGKSRCENITYKNLRLISEALGVEIEDLMGD